MKCKACGTEFNYRAHCFGKVDCCPTCGAGVDNPTSANDQEKKEQESVAPPHLLIISAGFIRRHKLAACMIVISVIGIC